MRSILNTESTLTAVRVKRLPKETGESGWLAILPETPRRPPLNAKIMGDWLIIGAGFAGLAAARRLVQLHPQQRIIVLDACRVAEGPAGRNSGFMIDLPHELSASDYGGQLSKDQLDIRLNRAGIAAAHQLKAEYNLSDEACYPAGKVNGAITEQGHQRNIVYAQHLTKLNEPFQQLDAKAMRNLTGSSSYRSGLFTPGTTIIQPAQFVRAVAEGIEAQGVQIYENSPVLELSTDCGDWVAHTPTGKVTAPKVILAVNGHAQSFGYYQGRLLHIFTYASMTRALSPAEESQLGGASQWALTSADPLGTTVRKINSPDGARIVIRNTATYNPSLRSSDAQLKRIGNQHQQSFRYRFPMLDKVTMQYRWGGRLCLSRNSAPAFGELSQGLYSACCQNGLGTAKGTIAGKLIAELASNIGSPLLSDMQTMASPAKLPPEPITWLGANLRLRWGEFRAGRER